MAERLLAEGRTPLEVRKSLGFSKERMRWIVARIKADAAYPEIAAAVVAGREQARNARGQVRRMKWRAYVALRCAREAGVPVAAAIAVLDTFRALDPGYPRPWWIVGKSSFTEGEWDALLSAPKKDENES